MSSIYYFNANAHGQKPSEYYQDIPIFAVHPGQNILSNWESGYVVNKQGFEEMLWKVNVQVPFNIALPKIIAHQFFEVGKSYQKLSIYAFKYQRGSGWQSDGGYMVGSTIALVLPEVTVTKITPIFQWKGLPPPIQVQKNYLERKYGTAAYTSVAVTLSVLGQTQVVE